MHPVLRTAFWLASVATTFLVFCMSAWFFTSTAAEPAAKWMYLGVSGISAFVKVLFPLALGALALPKSARAGAWAVVVCCVVFDSLGVSGFVTMTRGAGVEAKHGASQDYWRASAEVNRLRARFEELERTRATAIVRVELQTAKAGAPDCTKRPNAGLDACVKLGALEVEAATADERDKREREWREARDRVDKMARPNEAAANPLAQGVKPFADKLGLDAETLVDVVLRGLLAVLLEFTPSLCSYLALYGVKGARPRQAEQHRASDPPRRSQPASRAPPVDLLAILQDALAGRLQAAGLTLSGGGLLASNRALAKVAETSPTSVNHALRSLEASGKIKATPGPQGTFIELTT